MRKLTDLYLLTTLSNLHVGRGDSNYGIVDNEVQRDPITDYPTIFASSLKGALREGTQDYLTPEQQNYVFGTSVRETRTEVNGRARLEQGHYNFHQAYLLSLPTRGEKVPFYHATTPDLLQELKEQVNMFLPDDSALIAALNESSQFTLNEHPLLNAAAEVDEFEGKSLDAEERKKVEALTQLGLLNTPVAIFPATLFRSVCERLPVLARNQLEQGISKNLFYEEIVPRRTSFFFFIERPEGRDDLEEALIQMNHRAQVGANATLGYGVCQIQRISTTTNN